MIAPTRRQVQLAAGVAAKRNQGLTMEQAIAAVDYETGSGMSQVRRAVAAVNQTTTTAGPMNWHENPDVADWQHGMCDTYALALMETHPHLRFGILYDARGNEQHYFAHDDEYAYDSLGRHPLPYKGLDGHMEPRLDENPSYYFGDGEGTLFYPHGENGSETDYERAKLLISHQHPWLTKGVA